MVHSEMVGIGSLRCERAPALRAVANGSEAGTMGSGERRA